MADKKTSEEDLFIDDSVEDFHFEEDEAPKKSQPQPPSSPPHGGGQPPRGGPNKIILLSALLVTIIIVFYFINKFFLSPNPRKTMVGTSGTKPITPLENFEAQRKKAKEKELAAQNADLQTPKPNEKQPAGVPGPKEELAAIKQRANLPKDSKELPKKELPSKEQATKEEKNGKKPEETKLDEKNQFTESDISKAFSATGVPELTKPGQGQATTQNVPTGPNAGTNATGVPEPTSPTGVNAPSTQAASSGTVKEGSIQDLQKELFNAPPPKAIQEANAQADKLAKIAEEVERLKKEDVKLQQETEKLRSEEERDTNQLARNIEALSKLNQQMENNLNQIKYLEAYTREISETVTKLNSQISAMDNRILALTNTATSLSKDVGNVRSEVGSVKQALGDEGLYLNTGPAGKAIAVPGVGGLRKEEIYVKTAPQKCRVEDTIIVDEPEYGLHAVIPGRAWLKSKTGQIVTVTEGDVIGNYGKVIVIDAANGVVLTNSGITFRQ